MESSTFRKNMLLILGTGLITQLVLLVVSWQNNPFALVPIEDAAAVWDEAGRMARGDWLRTTPFLTAPLYLWMVTLLQELGGGLRTLYAAQTLLWLGTTATLILGARTFFERTLPTKTAHFAALVAGFLFLWLPEPSTNVGRVLNGSLQLFLAVTLWRALLADRPRAPLVGLLAGLNALANPPFLLAVLALPLWMGLKQGGRPAGLCLGTALLCIAPATWANHQVTGELIPISAQAGITFAHGNSPNADGLYTPIPGISPERRKQNLDALRMVEETTGSASWVGTSKHFMRQGFSWCVEHPLDALLNVGRKVSYFFTESSYGDVYQPRLEREQGFMTPPAPVGYGSWFLLPGLIAGYFLWRRKALGMSELIVIGIPLVTVALFFYSPRYRMAALPVLTVLTTWLLFARHAKNGSPALMGWLTPGLLLPIFVQTDISAFRPAFLTKLGSVWEQQGQWAKAAEAYRAGIQAGDAQAGPSLGHVLRRLGREAEGLRVLQQAVQQHPESAYAHRSLAVAFAENGRLEEAEPAFRKAIALEPNDFESLSGLGNLCFQSERLDEAEAFYRQSIAAHAGFPSAWFNLATVFEERGEDAEAIRHYQHALSLNPQLMPARLAAAALLATSLDESVRQGEQALFLMSVLPNNLHDDPALYELRAAALAAAGMFDQAAENQLHAMNLYGNADRGEERRTASRWLKRYQAEKVRTRDN